MAHKNKPKKTGAGLKRYIGILDKNDTEFDEIMKESRRQFKKWTKKYL